MTTYTNDTRREALESTDAWTITDWTEDLALDCNSEASLTALCNNFGTLIKQLIQLGIIKGTVATA